MGKKEYDNSFYLRLKKRIANGEVPKGHALTTCKVCSKSFVIKNCKIRKSGNICSSSCVITALMNIRKEKEEIKLKKWLAGEWDGRVNKVDRVSEIIRKYLSSSRGAGCEICGWNEKNIYSNTHPIQLHHIDGNSKNNRPENLQLLCPNHHSLTRTYCGRNRGNSKRYQKSCPGDSSL